MSHTEKFYKELLQLYDKMQINLLKIGRGLYIHISREDLQMANKHAKSVPCYQLSRNANENHDEIPLIIHYDGYSNTKKAIKKPNKHVINVGENIAHWNVKLCGCFGKHPGNFLKSSTVTI